ncbi:MAG: MCE family protein [Proteobacteria bacterium]|nr:MCE family protein [Pseudomonadota bacterium]NDC25436.1 MCE family protein [Pseudomonadota bacterium]NDD05297.1 MCE family protein [Pseudomonadota bacterium]NDG27768.1 MCE family protein [Pseudomonadota bacterium]
MAQQHRKQFWVGSLVLISVGFLFAFTWGLGLISPLSSSNQYDVFYNFAGGVEVGAPVRVSGIKVGKVEKIQFLHEELPEPFTGTSVKLTVSVNQEAKSLVKEDSKFYVNIAGIIGERYIEITPGSAASALLIPSSKVRGIDPPRVDQLLSQGYGVFGRVQDFLEQNESTLKELLTTVNSLMTDTNQLLKTVDRKKLNRLVDNLNEVSSNFGALSRGFREPRSRKFVDQVYDLVDRAHQIDKEALKQFFQEEGVRARIF